MKNLKIILNKLKNKSNIDYEYYFLFNNKFLDTKDSRNKFTINYIVYVVNSKFSCFYDFYKSILHESVTDVFIERLNLSKEDKINFFSMKFKNLFWIKINNIYFNNGDYNHLINFISNNSLDINRIFLENTKLEKIFFKLFENLKGFNNLRFLNFDNNNITNDGLNSIIYFLKNNKINLEYLSLINTNILDTNNLFNYLLKTDIRILDLSSNYIVNKLDIIIFIRNNKSIKELYLRNIIFTNNELEKLLELFENKESSIFNLRLSILNNQIKYKHIFEKLGKDLDIYFDINLIGESKINIYSTIYIKEINNKNIDLNNLSNDYFYIINSCSRNRDFEILLKEKHSFLGDGINLFLFEFNDYSKIDYLLNNYNFNYIYLENFYINDSDLIYFLDSIKKQKQKKYKINFISIEISEYQLNYLIDNFPENIFYIEINLNKIGFNRELYIHRMLKNKKFIFENMEFYQKIFK